MSQLTAKDRRLVKDNIHQYVQGGGDGEITTQDYMRAMRWSESYSFAEIAEEEGVSSQTVSRSVRKVVANISKWLGG